MKRDEDECGIEWSGEPEAITRLILGRSQQLPEILLRMGLEQEKLPEAMREIDSVLMTEVLHNPMPIQDAIDLANFLVDLTIRFTKFKPGGNTVGGPIEIAAITKHEGFKWVKRKHYFDKVLNSGADDARAT